MTKEGYWINYANGKEFRVREHEDWIRTPGNAKKLGLSKPVIAGFKKFKRKTHRDKFLLYIMKNAPVMRVRGHGSYTAFEYAASSRRRPLDAIWMWGDENLGSYASVYIANHKTGENIEMYFGEFLSLIKDQGHEAVMRHSYDNPVKESIVKELIKIARELGIED